MEKIMDKIVKLLMEENLKISFAESCTGGLLASELIKTPNASKVIEISFVTYSDDAKEKYLGVSKDDIQKYDVVSEEIALEMVLGVVDKTKSDIAISVTGNAGPTTCGNFAVGIVCFGFYIKGFKKTFRKSFQNMSREEIINASAEFAFSKLLELLIQNK